MKKLLIGCLIFIVLIIGLTIGVGWYLYSKASSFVQGYEQAIAQVQQIDQDFPWNPPPPGTGLAPARFNQYMLVRDRINDRLMQVSLFSELAESAEEERQANITAFQLMGVFTEIPGVLQDSVAAFREQSMSFREFGYHSQETLRAIRTGAQAGDPEMAELWEKLRGMSQFMEGQLSDDGDTADMDISGTIENLPEGEAPPETVALVRARLTEFKDSPARYLVELLFVQMLGEMERQ